MPELTGECGEHLAPMTACSWRSLLGTRVAPGRGLQQEPLGDKDELRVERGGEEHPLPRHQAPSRAPGHTSFGPLAHPPPLTNHASPTGSFERCQLGGQPEADRSPLLRQQTHLCEVWSLETPSSCGASLHSLQGTPRRRMPLPLALTVHPQS